MWASSTNYDCRAEVHSGVLFYLSDVDVHTLQNICFFLYALPPHGPTDDALPPHGPTDDALPPHGPTDDALPPHGPTDDALPPHGPTDDALPPHGPTNDALLPHPRSFPTRKATVNTM